MKKLFAPAIALALVLFSLFGCSAARGGNSYFIQLSVNPSSFYIEGERISDAEYSDLMQDLSDLLEGLEDKFSVGIESSDVSRVNAAKAGEQIAVSDDTFTLLSLCGRYYELSDGKFSPALFPLSELWGFSPDRAGHYNDARPEPSQEKILSALSVSDWNAYTFGGGNTVTKSDSGAKLDLGGIAKGYMADAVASYISDRYAGKRVDAIVSVMSSNMVLLGQAHAAGGMREYNIGIENPRAALAEELADGTPLINDPALYMVGLSDVSVTTSADNYRFYIENGKIYSHILDGTTGKPAENGIISVTVVVPQEVPHSGAFADALSTAGFCMPLRQAVSFFEGLSQTYGVGAVIITADHKYYALGGLNVMSAKEFVLYSNEHYGTSENAEMYADVFERGDLSALPDEIQNCDRETEYIEYMSSLLG